MAAEVGIKGLHVSQDLLRCGALQPLFHATKSMKLSVLSFAGCASRVEATSRVAATGYNRRGTINVETGSLLIPLY